MSKLSDKQQRFCEEYLIDLNATQATIRAGYSEASADVQGSRLLANDKIIREIDRLKAERSEKTEINAQWVLQRLAAEATADVADLYDENMQLKPVHDWPIIWRMGLVAGVEVEELFDGTGKDRTHIGHLKKVKLSDRTRRLELIGKHIAVSAFSENINVKGLDGLADRLNRAKSKAK
jgi:phage terminase small subunit